MKRVTDKKSFRRMLCRKIGCAGWSDEDFEELWKKYRTGEMLFSKVKGKPVGIVFRSIVAVRVKRATFRLIVEALPCETPLTTAYRGLRGFFLCQTPALTKVYARRERIRDSRRFPGLPVQYHTSCFRTTRVWKRIPRLQVG